MRVFPSRLLLLAAAVGLLSSAPRASCQQEPRNLVGSSVDIVTQPLGFDDPYSWMLGAGLFYERRMEVVGLSWVLGARVAVYAQHPLQELFGESTTIWGGGTLGLELARRVNDDFAFSLVPFVGFGHYWRQLEHDGATYTANRPLAMAGVNFDLLVGRRMSSGVSLAPILILDRAPLVAVGQAARLGIRF